MADSNIGSLSQAQTLDDDSLLVVEQQGAAMKVTGALLKEYAKQGVELEFQENLEAAQRAADRAEDAASSVTDMTVSAHASDTATVAKSMREGRVNLNFGLPRGEQGIPGPAGQTGPRGPQGAPGNGLTILGHYETEAALRAAVTAPEVGDAYSVGTVVPYDTYIFDGVTLDWKNYGPLSGGGGGVIPEDVVTAEGGAFITFPVDLGDGPHEITITTEEEPPLTAEDVTYGDGTVKDALDDLKSSVSDGKALVASAITDKGVPTVQDATFQQMADNIGQISTGSDISDATANPGDILAPKTAYTASGKVEGVIPSLPAQTITPGTADKTIANGQYLAGTQIIKGDPNLTSSNIRQGITLFGVEGAMQSAFAAILTVTADIGAVVTATCGDTSVEALSTTGTVVLELPIEGTWKVTAVRGVAQYNTVTIQVSSSYSATLTAVVHIERVGWGTSLGIARVDLVSASNGQYALFAGGSPSTGVFNYDGLDAVDAYDTNLVRTSTANSLSSARTLLAATSANNCVHFGGGINGSNGIRDLDVYRSDLTRTGSYLSEGRFDLSATSIGKYALFGGGSKKSGVVPDNLSAAVDAFDQNLTRTTPTALISARRLIGAASNENYALFCGGDGGTTGFFTVDAYDAELVRTIPTPSGTGSDVAVRAGNYVLHVGKYGSGNVYAYDSFLTRTTIGGLILHDVTKAGTTLQNFAILSGAKSGGTYSSVVTFDPYLVQTEATPLAVPREDLSIASIGDYALFGGGKSSEGADKTVEVYRYV